MFWIPVRAQKQAFPVTSRRESRVQAAVSHSVHRLVDIQEKKFSKTLDLFSRSSKIADGSALSKSALPCRGFTVGSEVSPRR